MTKTPVLKAPEIISTLRASGFEFVRQKGSHVRLRHPDGRVVTVPVHSGQDVSPGLLRKILRDAELSVEEFVELLRKQFAINRIADCWWSSALTSVVR